jgi:hypothetical protein
VVASDGSGDALVTSSAATAPVFSPDGARVAYGTANASGHVATVTVHPLSGGASDVQLTLNATRIWEGLTFSSDGGLVLMTSFDGVLAAAATAKSGAFIEIATGLADATTQPPTQLTPAHDYAAVVVSGRKGTVAATASGAAQTLAAAVDDAPWYEPVAATPRLLAFTSAAPAESGVAGSLVFFATDGTGMATTLPGAVFPAFTLGQAWHLEPFGWQGADSGAGQVAEPFTWGWLGSEIVYETNRAQAATPAFDVVAATDDAGTVGVIAPGALVWAVRDGAKATRVFFTRYGGTVWMSAVPQTPGR